MKINLIINKIFIYIICIAIFTLCVPSSVFATNSGNITIPNVRVKKGDVIDVPVVISNNPGITSVSMFVNYDTTVFSLISVQDSQVLDGFMSSSKEVDLKSAPYKLAWLNQGSKNNYTNDTIATLQFKIFDDAKNGDYTISISDVDIVDKDLYSKTFDITNGIVSIRTKDAVLSSNDGNITAALWFENDSNKKALAYFILYDKHGKMIGFATKTISNIPGQNIVINNIQLDGDISDVAKQQLLLLDTTSYTPLTNAIIFD